MTECTAISSRHLLDADGVAKGVVKPLAVRVVVAPQWGRSTSGQLLVTCLMNLLCRQVRVVSHVDLVLNEHPLEVLTPLSPTSRCLPSALLGMVKWAVGDAVAVTIGDQQVNANLTIVVGCPDQVHCSLDLPQNTLFSVGCGWKAWVGTERQAPRGVRPEGTDALGPFLAAALAAGEVFKRARGLVKGRFLEASGYSLWSGKAAEGWAELDNGPSLRGVMLPALHIIGAGAVGNAIAYTLGSSDLKDFYAVLVDDDVYDNTNLNRCFLAGLSDKDQPKVLAVERFLCSANYAVSPFPNSLHEYLRSPKPNLRTDVAKQIQNGRFGIVVSCVDKNTSRQDIQGLWPSLIVGGSTLNLSARSNIYSPKDGTACLACHNPAEREGDKIRSFESQLRAMSKEQRFAFLLSQGVSAEAIEEYLASPECGKVGQAALEALALRSTPQFSVGFVSLTAGLLLASALLRTTVLQRSAVPRQCMTILNFLSGAMRDSGLAVDPTCQQKCFKKQS